MHNLSQEEIEALLKDLELHNEKSKKLQETVYQLEFDFSKAADHNETIECSHFWEKYTGLQEVDEYCIYCKEKR